MNSVARALILTAILALMVRSVEAARVHSARTAPANSSFAGKIVPGIVMAKLQRGVLPGTTMHQKGGASLSAGLQAIGASVVKKAFAAQQPPSDSAVAAGAVDLSSWYVIRVDAGADPAERARLIATIPGIVAAEPKFINHILDIPDDTLYSIHQSPYFETVHAPEGWSISKGDTDIVIAVVDGGTYWRHPDIQPSLHFDPVDGTIGWNFANNTSDPTGVPSAPSLAEHGTETASVAAAATNNLIGIAGASWGCELMPICASAPDRDNDILFGFEGIEYAYRHGASIINCSWGRQGGYSLFEQDVITAAVQAGALVVTAAANSQDNNDFTPWYPGSYAGVLDVGATSNTSDVKAYFSNYGVSVPVYAPGVGIWAASADGGYAGNVQGTSFSAPLVSGLAGMLKSAHRSWTPGQIAEQIRMTCDSIDAANPSYAGLLGRGRVNFARALSESPSGIVVARAEVIDRSGKFVFLRSDTIAVRITIRNLLRPASNGSLTVSSPDASLIPLQGSFSLPFMNTGDSLSIPDAAFVVGPISSGRNALIRISWVANGNERDQSGVALHLFSTEPVWELQSQPVTNSLSSVHAVDTNIVWAAGGNGFATAPVVIVSTNGGSSWSDVTSNISGVDLYCISAVDRAHAWVGSGDGRIFATSNGGVSWSAQPYPGQQSPFIDAIRFFDVSNGVALGDPGSNPRYVVLFTTNGGATWVQKPQEPSANTGEVGWVNSMWWTDPLHGWFGSNTGVVYRTTNGGDSWTSSTSGSGNSIAVSFRNTMNGIVGHDDGLISMTTDGGVTWNPAESPTPDPIYGLTYVPGSGTAWAVSTSTSFNSMDDGSSWTAQSVYPILGQIFHLTFADARHGWSVTSDGEILRLNPSALASPAPGLPTAFKLYQNYPNPFNNGTLIQYDLPVRSRVDITIYDILGRKVRTLFNGVQNAGTPPPVSFQAGSLATGVYIYRITADPVSSNFSRYQSAGKMILLK